MKINVYDEDVVVPRCRNSQMVQFPGEKMSTTRTSQFPGVVIPRWCNFQRNVYAVDGAVTKRNVYYLDGLDDREGLVFFGELTGYIKKIREYQLVLPYLYDGRYYLPIPK